MATLDVSGGLDEILARTPNLADKVSVLCDQARGMPVAAGLRLLSTKGTRTFRVWLVIAEV